MKTIVVAHLLREVYVVRQRRTDLGEAPVTGERFVPRAAVWLRRGTEKDIEKARAWCVSAPARAGCEDAEEADWRVYAYDLSERDPLGRAKADILARKEGL